MDKFLPPPPPTPKKKRKICELSSVDAFSILYYLYDLTVFYE